MTRCICGAIAHIDSSHVGTAQFVCNDGHYDERGCGCRFTLDRVHVAYDDGRE